MLSQYEDPLQWPVLSAGLFLPHLQDYWEKHFRKLRELKKFLKIFPKNKIRRKIQYCLKCFLREKALMLWYFMTLELSKSIRDVAASMATYVKTGQARRLHHRRLRSTRSREETPVTEMSTWRRLATTIIFAPIFICTWCKIITDIVGRI